MIFLQTYLLNIPTKPPAVYATRLPQQLNPCHKCDGSVSYKDKLVTRKAFRSMLFYRRICCSLEGLEIEQRSIFFLWKRNFFVLSRAWNKRNSESLGGIEPQTFGFPAPMLYHRDSTVSKAYYEVLIWHASCIMHPFVMGLPHHGISVVQW